MFLRFPFVYAEVTSLGKLFYPFIRMQLKTIYGWQEFDFLVDTGADITTLPKTILPALGLDEKSLPKQQAQGVGGVTVETFETKLPVKLGEDRFKIHVSIVNTEQDGLPFLLGKKDIFEKRYSLEIDSKNCVTVIKKNDTGKEKI